MQGLLFDERQHVVQPAAWLMLVVAHVRIARPSPSPPAAGQPLQQVLVVHASQGELLEIVLALQLPPASRADCTAGSNKAIRMPMIVTTTRSSTSVKPRGLDRGQRAASGSRRVVEGDE